MKGIDILIVRLLPLVLFILFCINIVCCWRGHEEITLYYELHANSSLYALAFFLVSLSNKRYHCVWNRAMYMFLIVVPIFNFLDMAFELIPYDYIYLRIIASLAIITCVATTYLAIKHFIEIRKRRIANE